MAKYFRVFGHDVRVITNRHDRSDESAPLEIPADQCKIVELVRFEQTIGDSYYHASRIKKGLIRLKHAWRYQKRSFLLPDSSWPWYSEAIREADTLISEWKPDLIYSSALPISSHFIARKLSKRHKIDWIAEYRDLWSGGHGARVSSTLSWFLKKIEQWLIRPAMGLITVSAPLAAYLRLIHHKPVEIIYNGYDETGSADHTEKLPKEKSDKITLVYTGAIYEGRDPSMLFEALNRMGEEGTQIKVIFYTPDAELVTRLAVNSGVERMVEVHLVIPYLDSLAAQRNADILLYLSYSSSTHQGRGILSGKVFEYLGASRPILSVGADKQHLLVEKGLMDHATTTSELVNYLKSKLREKRTHGKLVCSYKEKEREEYSRKNQARKAVEFITKLTGKQQ